MIKRIIKIQNEFHNNILKNKQIIKIVLLLKDNKNIVFFFVFTLHANKI